MSHPSASNSSSNKFSFHIHSYQIYLISLQYPINVQYWLNEPSFVWLFLNFMACQLSISPLGIQTLGAHGVRGLLVTEHEMYLWGQKWAGLHAPTSGNKAQHLTGLKNFHYGCGIIFCTLFWSKFQFPWFPVCCFYQYHVHLSLYYLALCNSEIFFVISSQKFLTIRINEFILLIL